MCGSGKSHFQAKAKLNLFGRPKSQSKCSKLGEVICPIACMRIKYSLLAELKLAALLLVVLFYFNFCMWAENLPVRMQPAF